MTTRHTLICPHHGVLGSLTTGAVGFAVDRAVAAAVEAHREERDCACPIEVRIRDVDEQGETHTISVWDQLQLF